jgi:hypothetical protein
VALTFFAYLGFAVISFTGGDLQGFGKGHITAITSWLLYFAALIVHERRRDVRESARSSWVSEWEASASAFGDWSGSRYRTSAPIPDRAAGKCRSLSQRRASTRCA